MEKLIIAARGCVFVFVFFAQGEPGFLGPQGEPGLPGLPGTKVGDFNVMLFITAWEVFSAPSDTLNITSW